MTIFGFLSVIAPLRSRADEDLKQTLQSRYAMLKAAFAAHDASAIRALLTNDFQSIDVSGAISSGEQMIASVNALPPDLKKSSATTLLSINRSGAVATVEQQYEMKTSRAGNDGEMHPIRLVTVSTDIWTLSGSAWLLKSTATIEMTLFRDDRQVMHKVKP